jgi:hypothetical protein
MSRSFLAIGRHIALVGMIMLAACGGAEPRSELRTAAERVDEIRSGVLDFRLSVTSTTDPADRVGFTMEGPFEVAATGLEADLRYRQVAGSIDAEVRLVSGDGRAFVETGGVFYELPVDADATPGSATTVLEQLGFDRWAADPTVSASAAGARTISSPIAEVETVRGLRGLLDELEMTEAAGLVALDGVDERTIERTVRDGTMRVTLGPDDLLRELVVRMRFGVAPSSPLGEALADVVGAELLLELRIEEPNRPVDVDLPTEARPASELAAAEPA